MVRKKRKPADRSEYQRDYYARNRERIAARKKKRYEEDPEYRRKIRESGSVYSEKQKARRDKLCADGDIDSKSSVGKKKYVRLPKRKIYVTVNGAKRIARSTSDLADSISRTVATVYSWVRNGTLPRTPFMESNRALYTDAMILVVKMAVQAHGEVRDSKAVYNRVRNSWLSLGVPLQD